jgi:hypothetical protein
MMIKIVYFRRATILATTFASMMSEETRRSFPMSKILFTLILAGLLPFSKSYARALDATPEQLAEELGLAPESPSEWSEAQEMFWNILARSARVKIVIDLSDQRLTMTSPEGKLDTVISTGMEDYPTRKGCYGVTIMQRMHYSTLYDHAEMPFSIFYYRGYALHGYEMNYDGQPHSHGCVRIPVDTAERIYNIVKANRKRTSICIVD